MQCAPEAAERLSHNTVLRNTRETASHFSLSFFVLWTHVFFLGSSIILVHALHATRLGRTNFSTRQTFPWHCVTFVNFCSPNWSQDFVLVRGLHEDLAARRPEALFTNCRIFNAALNFCHFSLRLDCSSVWWCIQAHFLPNSQEGGVVQLPFRPALRLRLFTYGC